MMAEEKQLPLKLCLLTTDILSLNLYNRFLYRFFEIKKIINLPNKKKKTTVLKSPHVNKKSREQFEIRYYKRILYCYPKGEITFDMIRFIALKYLPANVSIVFQYN